MPRKVFAKAEIRNPTSGKLLAEGVGLFYMKKPPESTTTAALNAPGQPTSKQAPGAEALTARRLRRYPHDTMPYDEAIGQFGAGNSDAAVNIVEFYGGDMTALRRAKL